jgi:oxygen-independent coproporphyrinogen-3 oxidase
VHTGAQAERSYEILRATGFANLNLDLMFAVPTQTRAEWQTTLEKTIALQPEHISAYCLTYEEDTAFFERVAKGEWTPDEAWDADLFEGTMDTLEAAGYAQYEISNYARRDRECRHNLAYWLGADYLGLGPSAFSTVGSRRWQSVSDTASYCERIEQSGRAESFSEALSKTTRLGEYIAFGLRTNRGVTREVVAPWQNEVADFEREGFLRAEGARLLLTRRGKLLADAVAATFV